jgi:hypothetical protein
LRVGIPVSELISLAEYANEGREVKRLSIQMTGDCRRPQPSGRDRRAIPFWRGRPFWLLASMWQPIEQLPDWRKPEWGNDVDPRTFKGRAGACQRSLK